MAQDVAPNQPRALAVMVDRDGRLTSEGLAVLEQMWRQIAAGFVIVPCLAAGTNDITLTPVLHQEGARTYANHMAFGFVAAATSSGDVSVKVGSLGLLKAFKENGATRAGTGDVVNGSYYIASYVSSLDSGAGGFVLK